MIGEVQRRVSKVPEVTIVFWIIKVAATTLGETGGDTITMTLNWGYLAGTMLFLSSCSWSPKSRDDISSLALLGHDHRLDDLRHHDGGFRRSLARIGYAGGRRFCLHA